jgi:XTP/dITP diphosphohydrolase
MKNIIFATNNLNKVSEVKSIIGDKFGILSLSEAGIDIDIPEPFDTIEENAIERHWFGSGSLKWRTRG